MIACTSIYVVWIFCCKIETKNSDIQPKKLIFRNSHLVLPINCVLSTRCDSIYSFPFTIAGYANVAARLIFLFSSLKEPVPVVSTSIELEVYTFIHLLHHNFREKIPLAKENQQFYTLHNVHHIFSHSQIPHRNDGKPNRMNKCTYENPEFYHKNVRKKEDRIEWVNHSTVCSCATNFPD